MPLYEYSCASCGSAFEAFRRIAERDEAACPQCGVQAQRVFTPPGFLANGLSRSVPEWRPTPNSRPINAYTKL